MEGCPPLPFTKPPVDRSPSFSGRELSTETGPSLDMAERSPGATLRPLGPLPQWDHGDTPRGHPVSTGACPPMGPWGHSQGPPCVHWGQFLSPDGTVGTLSGVTLCPLGPIRLPRWDQRDTPRGHPVSTGAHPPPPMGPWGTGDGPVAPSLRLKSLAADESFSTCLTKMPWSPPPVTL